MNDEEYCELTELDMSSIHDLCEDGKLTIKVENCLRYIVPVKLAELSEQILMR